MRRAEPERSVFDILQAATWSPETQAVGEWLRRIQSGGSLTLAEYARAEEMLAPSLPRQAQVTVGVLGLAPEGQGSRSLPKGFGGRLEEWWR